MEFNVRFQPSPLLDVDDLRYCEFCSQAALSSRVHSNQSCILDELSLNSCSDSNTISLNFGFYQCFLKNCSTQAREAQEFGTHLSQHGICLHQAKSKYRYKCEKCSYKTTQQRYLDNHKQRCTGNGGDFECEPKDTEEKKISSASSSIPISTTSLLSTPIKHERMEPPLTSAESLLARPGINPDFNPPNTGYHYVKRNELHSTQFASGNIQNLELKKCTRCRFKTRNSLLLSLHEQFCIQNKRECNITLKPKTFQILLDRSMLTKVAAETVNFNCDLCSFAGSNNMSVKMHKIAFHGKHESRADRDELAKIFGEQVSCPNCPYKPSSAHRIRAMTAHLKFCGIDHRNKVYKCASCFYLTGTRVNLIRHKRNCIKEDITINDTIEPVNNSPNYAVPKLKCSFCPYKARLSIMIKHHERKCNSVLLKNFRCKRCSDVLTTREKFERHIMNCKLDEESRHSKLHPRNEELSCKNCSFLTKSRFIMGKHSLLCGIPIKSFRCEKCHYISRNRSDLNRHISICKRKDTGIKTLSCPKCLYYAPNQASLAVHATLCGISGSNSRRCQKCHFIAKSAHGYLQHRAACKHSVMPQLLKKSQENSPTLIKCSKCHVMVKYSLYHKNHLHRCRNSLFDAFKCTYESCFFIGSGAVSLKKHTTMVHELKVNHNPVTKLNEHCCVLCPYVNSIKAKTDKHMILCHLRKDGCKEVVSCNYPGCFFLAKNKNGMITHSRTIHSKPIQTVPSKPSKKMLQYNSSENKEDVEKAMKSGYQRKRKYCNSCPYSVDNNKSLLNHESLCAEKKNSVCGIIACKYPNCYFLSKSIAGYKSHLVKMHLMSEADGILQTERCDVASLTSDSQKRSLLIDDAKKKQVDECHSFNCDTCLYSCRNRGTLPAHRNLCSRRIKGDKSIIECGYPGCYSLFSSKESYRNHRRKYKHQRSNFSVKDILKSSGCEAKDNDAEQPSEVTEEVTTSEHIALAGYNDSDELHPLLAEGVRVIDDYYSCVNCSYKCLHSDGDQIKLHEENCPTQLSGDLSIAPSQIIEEENDETHIARVIVNKEDDVTEIPGKSDNLEFVTTEKSDSPALGLGNSIEPQLELIVSTIDPLEEVAINLLDVEFSEKDDTLAATVTCSSEPASSGLLDDELLKENDMFASEDIDGLSFCLDSDYFV